ncbi:MAG TPA: hypothetical protein VMH00_05485 [Candidatus Limnocylindrales bacterium]|nr:hypothetical protein [Candidatus Limnocylindrales bacterium]
MPRAGGMLSDTDIKEQLRIGPQADLHIERAEECLITPVGYDVRPGDTVFSLRKKKKLLLSKSKSKPTRIAPGDTFFIPTYESFSLSSNIGGLTISRLGPLLDGLQMTALTVDPSWNGKLLIILTNQGVKPVPIEPDKPFMTICFFWAASTSAKQHDRKTWDDKEVEERFVRLESEARKTAKIQLAKDVIVVCLLALLCFLLYRFEMIGKYLDSFSLWLGATSIYFSLVRKWL